MIKAQSLIRRFFFALSLFVFSSASHGSKNLKLDEEEIIFSKVRNRIDAVSIGGERLRPLEEFRNYQSLRKVFDSYQDFKMTPQITKHLEEKLLYSPLLTLFLRYREEITKGSRAETYLRIYFINSLKTPLFRMNFTDQVHFIRTTLYLIGGRAPDTADEIDKEILELKQKYDLDLENLSPKKRLFLLLDLAMGDRNKRIALQGMPDTLKKHLRRKKGAKNFGFKRLYWLIRNYNFLKKIPATYGEWAQIANSIKV